MIWSLVNNMSKFLKWLKELLEKLLKPDPEPNPDPDQPGDPDEPGNDLPDAIDWKDIAWLGVNVGAWEKKFSLKVSLKGSLIVYDQEGTSKWPTVMVSSASEEESVDMVDDEMVNIKATALTGNPWIIAKLNGKWTAATHEWMRPGQKEKGKRSVHGDHIKRNEFGPNWTPTVGEEYGFCVSGLCRGVQRNQSERTQIVLMKWK